jgi:hypothetical protein
LTDPYLWGIEKDMAKRQTRRSISVSRSTYERLRAYCETNGISMSQFVEHRVGDYLGRSILRPAVPAGASMGAPMTSSPFSPSMDDRRDALPSVPAIEPVREPVKNADVEVRAAAPAPASAAPAPVVMATAPAAPAPTRQAIVHRPAPAAPPPVKLRPDQIFTF